MTVTTLAFQFCCFAPTRSPDIVTGAAEKRRRSIHDLKAIIFAAVRGIRQIC